MEEKTKRQAKAFNQINFNINDAFGREATKRLFFRRWGIILKDSKDKFGIDLFGLHNDTKLYVECSVNNTKGWVNNTFYTQNNNIKDIAIYQRRLKTLHPSYKKNKCLFSMTNKTGTCFAICKITHDILTLPLEPYKQRPVSTNETVGEEEALLINKKHFRFYEI
jgi:hypothetical protein